MQRLSGFQNGLTKDGQEGLVRRGNSRARFSVIAGFTRIYAAIDNTSSRVFIGSLRC